MTDFQGRHLDDGVDAQAISRTFVNEPILD